MFLGQVIELHFAINCKYVNWTDSNTKKRVPSTISTRLYHHGPPEHIRSDNGPEFAAKAVRQWLSKVGVRTLFIEPGSPWENGYIETFNGRLALSAFRSRAGLAIVSIRFESCPPFRFEC